MGTPSKKNERIILWYLALVTMIPECPVEFVFSKARINLNI